MNFSKQLYLFLTICFIFQPLAYGEPNRPQSGTARACKHLSIACKELEGLYDECYNSDYLPVEKICCWKMINFYAEYLWWRIFQDKLHYAITGVDSSLDAAGELFALEGTWDSGFRIGSEICFPFNGWKLFFDWTRFRNHDRDDVFDTGLTLRATRGTPDGIDVIDSAESDFRFKLDSFRLALQLPLFTRTHVAVQPIAGIRADRISEDFLIIYRDNEGIIDNTFQYWGIGPEVGLDTIWYLLPCFALYGRATVAGLYGNFDMHQEQFDSEGDEVNVRSQFDRMQSTLSATLGVQWEGLCFRNILLSLKLGWETNIWFSLNSILSFSDAGTEGTLVNSSADLRTSGLTLRAKISF